MTRSLVRALGLLGLALALAACVTVNIYFPAAKVEKTADEIVGDVYGKEGQEAPQTKPEPKKPGDSSSLMRFLTWLGPAEAQAQDVESVSNAPIRALKEQLKGVHRQLVPFYQQGRVGINKDGFVQLRETQGLPLPQLANLKRLVEANGNLKRQLYAEVAKALQLKSQQVGQVQEIFARKWREKARPGWWVQDDGGQWRKK